EVATCGKVADWPRRLRRWQCVRRPSVPRPNAHPLVAGGGWHYCRGGSLHRPEPAMRCPKCQHENSGQAKHCEKCGAPLGQTCANWGGGLSSSRNFCSQWGPRLEPVANDPRFASPSHYTPQHLADKILVSRVALEGERKQVTVLFADVKGSTGLLADLDPE